jgi:hypothetical protein
MCFQPALQSFAFAYSDAQAALVVEQLVEAGGAHTPLLEQSLGGADSLQASNREDLPQAVLGFHPISEKHRVLENMPSVFDIYIGLCCMLLSKPVILTK